MGLFLLRTFEGWGATRQHAQALWLVLVLVRVLDHTAAERLAGCQRANERGKTGLQHTATSLAFSLLSPSALWVAAGSTAIASALRDEPSIWISK